MSADLRPDFVRWRDEHFLAHVARALHDRGDVGRVEALDLHRALGQLLGVGGRGGAQTKPRWVPCGLKKRARCATCQSSPGHGPYLYRREGRRWVMVKEPEGVVAARRERALGEVRKLETEHALALLERTIAESEGILQGKEAEEARRRVLRSIHS